MKALLAALLAVPALAAAEAVPRTAPELLKAWLQAEQERAWLSADITKSEAKAGSPRPPRLSRGRLQVARGGKARLQLESPSPGLMLADGKRLWVEMPEVKQVMCYDQASLAAGGNFFLDLPASIRHYSRAGKPRPVDAGPGWDRPGVSAVEIRPRDPEQAGFSRLKVWVDSARWVLLRACMEQGARSWDVRFENIAVLSRAELAARPQAALRPELFRYRPPGGYEVFKLDP